MIIVNITYLNNLKYNIFKYLKYSNIKCVFCIEIKNKIILRNLLYILEDELN